VRDAAALAFNPFIFGFHARRSLSVDHCGLTFLGEAAGCSSLHRGKASNNLHPNGD
jgi:hypothetical protein